MTARAEVDETVRVMKQNLDTVLDRGEKLSELVEKADSMQAMAKSFRAKSGKK